MSTVQDFEDVLVYLDDTIEQDVEQLSENGSDRMFLHLSIVFTTLYQLLSYCKTTPEAEEMASCCHTTWALCVPNSMPASFAMSCM